MAFKYEPRMLISIYFQSEEVNSWYNDHFRISESFRLLFYLFSLFRPLPSMKGSFTLYILLWIIFILHLLIIQSSTWVLVPSDTLSSSLWVAVAKVTLFRGLLHINAARKVTAVHLMWWWQPSLRYFQVSFLLMCPRSTSMLLKLSGRSL